MLNNYFSSQGNSRCVQAGFEADLLVEANVFEGVRDPIDLRNNTGTAVQLRDNVFINVTGTREGDGRTAFTPSYNYTALAGAAVKDVVTNSATGAGANLSGNVCTFSAIY
jgi:pectate lyase